MNEEEHYGVGEQNFCGDLHLCDACCSRSWPKAFPFYIFDEDDGPVAHLTCCKKTVSIPFFFKQFTKTQSVMVDLNVWQLKTSQKYNESLKKVDPVSSDVILEPYEILREHCPEQLVVEEPAKAEKKRKSAEDDRWKSCKHLLN